MLSLVLWLGGDLSSASGQCLVQLRNSSSTLVSLSIPSYPTWPPPGKVLYALLTAPVGTTDLTQFKPTAVLATNRFSDGRVLGSTVTLSDWPIGETRAFAIVGWFASLGTNFNPAWLNQGCIMGAGRSAIGNWEASLVLGPLNPFTVLGAGFTISGPISPMQCPQISQPPVSQSVTQGAAVTFAVIAGSGYPPPSSGPYYFWHFNGVPLVGSTNSTLVLTNVQPAQAGAYYVSVENPPPLPFERVSSAIATLEVHPRPVVPPVVTVQPLNQTAEIGGNVGLTVRATGDLPLTYRWVQNGTNTVGMATNAAFAINNIQAADAGIFSVIVTNGGGAVTSAPAMLNVIPAVPRRLVPGIVLMAQSNSLLNLEYRPSLLMTQDWESFPTFYFTNSPQFFFDLTSPLPPQRFYRASQTAPVSMTPTLGLHMIPALTLTGSLGERIRVNGINQFGPTDSWFTLDTVTLTNTSQLYFDVAAPGQPARLYRLVTVP